MCSDGVAARSSARSPAPASDVWPGNFPAGRLDGHPHGAPPEAQIRRVSPAVPLRRRRCVGRGREIIYFAGTPLPDRGPRRRLASTLSIARRRRPPRRRTLKATRASSEAARLRSAQRSYLGPNELGRERAARSRGSHAYERRPAARRRLSSYADVPKSHLTGGSRWARAALVIQIEATWRPLSRRP